jgi:hypothetical protein
VDKFIKFLAGLLLLPFCYAATMALVTLLRSIQPDSAAAIPWSVRGLIIGFLFWVFLYLSMSRPVRSYVFAHELTHALWGWVMGARIKKLRISRQGGSVTLSKSNFLIELAPYFFPLYTVLVILTYHLLGLFFDLHVYEPFWLGLIGLTWGFHLTFTISTLLEHQPDIHENGRLFSYALIYLMNVLGIALWIVMIASPTLTGFGTDLGNEIMKAFVFCAAIARKAWDFFAAWIPEISRHWKK